MPRQSQKGGLFLDMWIFLPKHQLEETSRYIVFGISQSEPCMKKKHQIPTTESSWSISYQSMEIMASQPTPPNEIASLKGLLTIRFLNE